MADTDGSSNSTAIVAIVALIFIAIAGFFAYQNGMFGGKKSGDVNIEMKMPDAPNPN